MDRKSKTLFVRNLPFTASTQKLVESFEDVGPLKTAFVVADKESGKCKGYGYVQFSMLEDAEKAIQTVTHCDGRKIFVSFADAKKNWKKKQKKDDSSQKKDDSSQAQENKPHEKESAAKQSKSVVPKQKPVKRCRLIVRNLSFKCKESHVRAHFEKCGPISEVTIPLKNGKLSRGFAFVQFTQLQAAQKAVAKINGQEIMGRPVAVDWAVAKDRFVASSQPEPDSDKDSEGSEEEEKEDMAEESSDSEEEDEEEESEEDETESEESDSEEAEEDKSESESEESDSDEDEEAAENDRKEKAKLARKSDVDEGRTLFIRNVPFEAEEEELEEVFEEFGDVAYVRMVMDKVTGQSRGTAFVQFADKESAEQCLAKAEESQRDGGIRLQGRPLLIAAALNRTQAQNQKEASKTKEQKDNRNLFLAREGMIREGTQAAAGVSQEDMKKRMKIELAKREKLKNLSIFVSSTRLCVHNLLPRVDEKELKKVIRQIVDDPAMNITECRVMRDLERRKQSGVCKSLGFAFINFSTHEHALKALRGLNNSTVFGDSRRPIAEFSLENKKALEAKQKRLEKSRVQAAKKNKEADNAQPKPKPKPKAKPKAQTLVTDKIQDRMARNMHGGAPKGMPKRLGPKIRHRKRQQEQQQGKNKKKKNQHQHQPRSKQQPKPKMMKKKRKEVTDRVDKLINKRQGKKSRWFET